MKSKKKNPPKTNNLTTKHDYFIATDVTVLKLNYDPDQHGQVIPPEAFIEIHNPVPILVDFNWERVIGQAHLMRQGNKVVAEMEFSSPQSDTLAQNVQTMMQMYPAVGGQIMQFEEVDDVNHILHFGIMCLSVCWNPNADSTIPPLGSKVRIKYDKRAMN